MVEDAISLLLSQRRYQDAARAARELTLAYPKNGFGWKALGIAVKLEGRIADAIVPMQHAVALLPDDAAAHANLGIALVDLGRLDEAAQPFERALALDPDWMSVHIDYGVLCQRRGQLPCAIAHFRQALALRLCQATQAVARTPAVGFDTHQHESLLWLTLAQLARAGAHAFAHAGTLLGLQREGHLLPFDKDIDFGLPYAEHGIARACLLENGWQEITHIHGLVNPRPYLHLETKLALDICLFHVESTTGKTIGGFWLDQVPWEWNRITDYPNLNLIREVRPAGWVWTLAEPHPWLQAIYGDWRTPDPDFDSVTAAYNQRGFSLFTQSYAFLRIFLRWHRGDLKKALNITRHSLRQLPDDALLQQVEAHLAAAQEMTKTEQSNPTVKDPQ